MIIFLEKGLLVVNRRQLDNVFYFPILKYQKFYWHIQRGYFHKQLFTEISTVKVRSFSFSLPLFFFVYTRKM